MPTRRNLLVAALAASASLGFLGSPNAPAQNVGAMQELMEKARAQGSPGKVVVQRPGDAPLYGTGTITLNVNAYAFQGANSSGDLIQDDGNGYRFLTASTSGGYLAAPVSLPPGIIIDSLGVSHCAGATGALTVALYDASWGGLPISLVTSLTTQLVNGCGIYAHLGIDQPYYGGKYHPLYLVMHWEGPLDGSLKFNNVSIEYRQTVAPAPPVASFGDVPVSHPFFQFVEALAASGITAGCGNGNFCPDNPLTRGQMAVFLSKALGLYWPN